MRRVAFALLVLLSGCAPAQPPVRGETPGRVCDAEGTERFIGQPGNSETETSIKRASHAAVLRWAPLGVMLTMDFRADRVTVHLGADRRITKITCG